MGDVFGRPGRDRFTKGRSSVSTIWSQSKSAPAPAEDLQSAVTALDWEWTTANTRYLTHDLHRYSGKFIPQIAAQAVELLTEPGDIVLDPMAGSGTTLVEAWRTSRTAIGFDLSPLAVMIARAKVQRIAPEALDDMLARLLGVVQYLGARESGQLGVPDFPMLEEAVSDALRDPRAADPWFVKWFQPRILSELLVLDAAIEQVGDGRARNLAQVALSEILRRSSNAHSGFPNVMFDRKASSKPSPAPAFARTLIAYAERTREILSFDNPEPSVELRDARYTGLAEASVDAIVSHPPYIGSIPYAEYGLISLKWLGADNRSLDRELMGGRRQSRDVVDRFESTYTEVLSEAHRVLRPSGGMFLMVGDPVVRGDVIDLAAMTREKAVAAGFAERATTTRRGMNRRANKMAHETLLFFEKPR
jgi:SAM-dependent methyltransferase